MAGRKGPSGGMAALIDLRRADFDDVRAYAQVVFPGASAAQVIRELLSVAISGDPHGSIGLATQRIAARDAYARAREHLAAWFEEYAGELRAEAAADRAMGLALAASLADAQSQPAEPKP